MAIAIEKLDLFNHKISKFDKNFTESFLFLLEQRII